MTLEEQIRPHTISWDCYNDCPVEYNHTGKVLKIINLFAIEFAEWCVKNEQRINYSQNHTIKELLEIYKIEKGL